MAGVGAWLTMITCVLLLYVRVCKRKRIEQCDKVVSQGCFTLTRQLLPVDQVSAQSGPQKALQSQLAGPRPP